MEEKKHAILSPSASSRWLRCTASPLLESKEPEESSPYAEEGTCAHAVCAKKLLTHLGLDAKEEDKAIAELGERWMNEEMEAHCEAYAEEVISRYEEAKAKNRHAVLLVETKLDFGKWVPGGESYGTGDAVIISGGTLEIIDFKYGKGVEVSATENPQMMIYALGALDYFGTDYSIDTVRMTIIQPRLGNYSTWETTDADLYGWAKWVLAPKAKEALAGGQQMAGGWCRFCKLKGKCSEQARMVFADVTQFDTKTMTPEEIALRVLPKLEAVKSWVAAAEERALKAALEGTSLPGYKLVEGRSARKVAEPEMAAAALVAKGYAEAAVWKPRELRTISDLEKTVGKKAFAEICGAYIVKPQGKPTLVPEADKRPALSNDCFAGLNLENN